MSKAKYIISKQALCDLEEVWFYTVENWSIEQADRYYHSIISEIEHISNFYESGKSISKIRLGYRTAKVNSHLIFYKKNNEGMVEIIRILHEKMDYGRHLK